MTKIPDPFGIRKRGLRFALRWLLFQEALLIPMLFVEFVVTLDYFYAEAEALLAVAIPLTIASSTYLGYRLAEAKG